MLAYFHAYRNDSSSFRFSLNVSSCNFAYSFTIKSTFDLHLLMFPRGSSQRPPQHVYPRTKEEAAKDF